MAGNDDDESDPNRTVFMPSAAPGAPPAPPAGPPADAPGWGPTAPPPASQAPAPPVDAGWGPTAPPSHPAAPEPPAFVPPPLTPPPAAAAPKDGRVAIGAVLNHIYEVKRFIARGGMGEVYEGVNVNTDERVAIKVMLPHLAADPNIQAMFRKEARTLTRLAHPAVVQYRVLAQEPGLGVFYIVTEFIDGEPLGDLIGRYEPTPAQLESLTRRLAAGLNAAHELGAIHRDMSPDNVLLPGGRLDQAKVIDFGIAKDLDPSNATIVGDGFAGKLGFVAPEQFGDFDRSVGPWTDVYSLALVLLTFADGKAVDMGATLVEAIDKRRKGPDLSRLPDNLRPVFAGMLQPNPQERFRSMAEVLTALDAAVAIGAAPAPVVKPAPEPTAKPSTAAPAAPKGKPPMAVLIGGAAAVLVVVVAGVGFLLLPKTKPAPAASGAVAASTPAASAVPAVAPQAAETVRQTIAASLKTIPCTWLNIEEASGGPGGVTVSVSGVAGDPAAANAAVSRVAGAGRVTVDTSAVSTAAPQACRALDAFRQFRVSDPNAGQALKAAQREPFTLQPKPENCPANNAKALVDLRIGDASRDFSVVGMEPSGRIQALFASRADFMKFKAAYPEFVQDLGGDAYRMTLCTNQVGPAGLLLVKGQPPFTTGAPKDPAQPKPGWETSFAAAGQAKAWQTEMAWYKVVG